MARLTIPLSDLIDLADWEAYRRDLIRILTRYGIDEEDCPPHLRAERARAIHTANMTFDACCRRLPSG